MFSLLRKNLKIKKMSSLITIAVGQSSMHSFPSLLFKNDRILILFILFSSLNNFKTLPSSIFKINLSFFNCWS